MIKTLIATAIAALAFTGVASAQTVVHKEVTVQRDNGSMMHHDNGMHRGHAYGHNRREWQRREWERRHMHHNRPMARHHVSKDVITRHGDVKHVEKNVTVHPDGSKTVRKVVTQ